MIPLSRINNDDRPAGLKLARSNNNFAFPSTNTDNTGGSLLDDDFHWLDQNTRTSMESNSRRYVDSGRFHQPSIPARSPFRIRDSQTSITSRTASTAPISNSYQSTKWTPTAAFESEDMEPKNVMDNRTSLSVEVARMWKRQPTRTKSEETHRRVNKEDEGINGLLGQLLVSQALVDAELFNTLSFEQLDELKQQRSELQGRIATLETRWTVDKHVQDVSRSLSHLDRAAKIDAPSNAAASELIQLLAEEAAIRQKILEHTAGALKLGVEKRREEDQRPGPVAPLPPIPVSIPASTPASLPEETARRLREKDRNIHEQERNIREQERNIREQESSIREKDEEIEKLKSKIKQMTGAMVGIAERQQITAATDDENEWAAAVESQFGDYKAQMQRLERELTSHSEKLRLEQMSVKKYEMQLRIMQEKRDTAEAKYRDMEKKYLDRQLDVDSYNNTSSATLQLENDLAQAKQDFQKSQEQVSSMQVTLAEMEVRCTKAESEASASAAREIAADARMEKYQNEASTLRVEKQRWERALKRESVLQMMEGGSDSFKAKYEQQLEEQRQEYEAELQEQRAFLAKTTRAQQQAEADRDKMSAVCKDLEDLIRDKSRTIDARDVRINQIEEDMKELRLQKPLPRAKNEEVEKAQKAFTEREQAWLAQSASMEADFEGIMKEFDRLTVAAMDFETDRMKYEQRIDQLKRDLERVEGELTEARIDKLGYGDKEGPTTASLRKEFRQLVSNLKSDHQRLNERQADERKQLENRLKDLKHELETNRYERVNRGVQTNFVA